MPELNSPEFKADPYRIYSVLRGSNPVVRDAKLGAWLVTNYDGVAAGLRDPKFSSDRRERILQLLKFPAFAGISSARLHTFLDRDPPDHTRLRSLVGKAFSPQRISSLEKRIQEVVDGLLNSFPDHSFDIVSTLAEPLPLIVIAELLGVPTEDRPTIKQWSDAVADVFSGNFEKPDSASLSRAAAALSELFKYLGKQIELRRSEPQEDLLTALVQAEHERSRLTEDEIFSTILLLLIAGNETTTNLIGNGLYALFKHPDIRRELWADPTLLPRAVEEMLRYDSPVQMVSRTARAGAELMGVRIPEGEILYFILGAANRDPAHFPEPDRFHLRRDSNRHISFGAGPHYCLGATLARLEATVVFRSLIQQFSTIELTGETPTYRDNFNLRGLTSLTVSAQR